jgi:hypothetical protein
VIVIKKIEDCPVDGLVTAGGGKVSLVVRWPKEVAARR